jgi:hypothetical protein
MAIDGGFLAILHQLLKVSPGIVEDDEPVAPLNSEGMHAYILAFILGLYLGAVVSALVKDLIMPIIGLAIPGLGNLSTLTVPVVVNYLALETSWQL